ncbi:hypothetical protein Y032_1035g3455 [Ancylostoma ceylanicum]|nr:hypothetical protein Y032_1035g3455 [Ancylostoma ceylanicum]
MGLRLAPLLAIVYLDRIERMSLTSELIFYRRYIDDVFAIGSTPSALQHVLNNLNSQDPNIRFTVEEPDANGFLPFPNAKVRIRNGSKEYRKPSSKSIIIHSRSAHPIYMKANVVRNIRQTKDRICGVAHDSCDEDMEKMLEENGYNKNVVATWHPFSPPDGISMVLPFIDDRTSREVNKIVKRSSLPIRLIFKPPPNLKDLLTSSRQYEEKCETADYTRTARALRAQCRPCERCTIVLGNDNGIRGMHFHFCNRRYIGWVALILNEDSGDGSSDGGGFFISITAACWRGVFNYPYSLAVSSFGIDDRSDQNQCAARGIWQQPH